MITLLIGYWTNGLLEANVPNSHCTKATWVHPPLDLINFDK